MRRNADEEAGVPAALGPPPRASARTRVGVGAALVLVLLAAGIAVLIAGLDSAGSAQRIAPAATSAVSSAAPASAGEPSPAAVYVHVLGAVANSGLFVLHSGDRVVDAIAAAGGFTADAERGGVNLARVVADGEQIVVLRMGEAAPPPGEAASGGTAAPADSAGTVSLNTATAAELETLPRIGPAMAQRIVEYREANGPFTSVDQLLEVTGIGEKTLDAFRAQVTL